MMIGKELEAHLRLSLTFFCLSTYGKIKEHFLHKVCSDFHSHYLSRENTSSFYRTPINTEYYVLLYIFNILLLKYFNVLNFTSLTAYMFIYYPFIFSVLCFSCSLYILHVNLHELIMSRTLYFFDFRHAFFQIFTSLILEYMIQSMPSYIYSQYFSFFLALKIIGHLTIPGILVNEQL